MNKNKHLISKYLDGELDALTAARFEEELLNNPALRAETDLYQKLVKALADSEVMQLRMQLNEIHEKVSPEPVRYAKPRVRKAARIAVAASFSLLLGFSVLNYFQSGTTQKLIEKYYQPYEVTSTNRSGTANADKTLRIALEKYQNRQYGEAVVLFEKALASDPGQMATQLYSGISYFEIAEYINATKSFTRVIEHNDNLYIEQAKWYLGLCYLKNEEKEKAVRQFSEIAKSDSYYSAKAKAILKKLR
jgi:tetratricopeptide (TPR) repeat protein